MSSAGVVTSYCVNSCASPAVAAIAKISSEASGFAGIFNLTFDLGKDDGNGSTENCENINGECLTICLLYTSPSPRD